MSSAADRSVRIFAQTISRTISEWLHQRTLPARVLASFDRACNLIAEDGTVVALVTPAVGNGPLNVVAGVPGGRFPSLGTADRAVLSEDEIGVGHLVISLENAVVWEPQPDWDALRVQNNAIATQLPFLQRCCLERAPHGGLAPLLDLAGRPPADCLTAAASEAAAALREGWKGNAARLQEGVSLLAGLGGGLTPSGDDFLAGVMFWAWLAHPDPRGFCRTMVEATKGRTTALSQALLGAAARGECSAAWHDLLRALSRGTANSIVDKVHGVLALGATSGADTLAGFVWAGTRTG